MTLELYTVHAKSFYLFTHLFACKNFCLLDSQAGMYLNIAKTSPVFFIDQNCKDRKPALCYRACLVDKIFRYVVTTNTGHLEYRNISQNISKRTKKSLFRHFFH